MRAIVTANFAKMALLARVSGASKAEGMAEFNVLPHSWASFTSQGGEVGKSGRHCINLGGHGRDLRKKLRPGAPTVTTSAP
jgi:hypothetical protein